MRAVIGKICRARRRAPCILVGLSMNRGPKGDAPFGAFLRVNGTWTDDGLPQVIVWSLAYFVSLLCSISIGYPMAMGSFPLSGLIAVFVRTDCCICGRVTCSIL